MLVRTRLHEFYERIVREDMLTLFGRAVRLDSLECSVVLPAMVSEEAKYRAACILEIVTGQRVQGETCEIPDHDPLYKRVSIAQQKEMDRIRGATLRQSLQKGKSPKTAATAPKLTSADFKKLGSGFKLKTRLSQSNMFDFLEKCREFFLPDVLAIENIEAKEGVKYPERGHYNGGTDRVQQLRFFQKWTLSRLTIYPPRHPLRKVENPAEATTAYILRSTDLLKFPDVEFHFESMARSFSDNSSEDSGVQLILRPTLKVSQLPELEDPAEKERKYFDSGDYALSKTSPTIKVGQMHPSPERISLIASQSSLPASPMKEMMTSCDLTSDEDEKQEEQEHDFNKSTAF